jgi:nicotinate-nucleotide adenylyltransferase
MEIGVFGGTFDPPHVGHVAVAEDARSGLGLDRILFVPARVSPFKVGEAGITDPELRLRMTSAALRGHPGLSVDRLELDRDPPSWTVDTLRDLRKRMPDARLHLLLGADQWASFGRWKDVEEIGELADIVVMARDGHDPSEVDPGLGAGVDLPWRSVDVRRIDVSSTDIRERVRAGEPIEGLVPPAVARIIHEHELYRAASAANTA